jgi:hypothetical protein
MLTDRQLFDLMWQASWRATETALAAGHTRHDQITKDSAWSAAQAVYQRERPGEAPLTRHPLPPVPDVVQQRMEREPVAPPPPLYDDSDMPF